MVVSLPGKTKTIHQPLFPFARATSSTLLLLPPHPCSTFLIYRCARLNCLVILYERSFSINVFQVYHAHIIWEVGIASYRYLDSPKREQR